MVALTTHAKRVFGQIAQLVEHEPEELGVLGSIPSLSIRRDSQVGKVGVRKTSMHRFESCSRLAYWEVS